MKTAIADYVVVSNGNLLAKHDENVSLVIVLEKVALLKQTKSPIKDR
jgi:hypothetical protein